MKERCSRYYLVFLLLYTALWPEATAQTPLKDSLERLLNRSNNPKQQVDILSELAYTNYDFNDSLAFEYAREALNVAQRIDYGEGLQYAHTLIGIGHFSAGRYEQALEEFNRSAAYSTRGTLHHTIYNLMLKGNVQTDLGFFDSAQVQYNKGIQLMDQVNDHRYEAQIYKGYARLKLTRWQNEEALHYLRLADEARKGETDTDRIDLYLVYARIYAQMSNFRAATENIDKVCQYSDPLDNNFQKGMCHLVRADILYAQGLYPGALTECFAALELSKIYAYPLMRAMIYTRLGETYAELSEYKLASDFFYRALKITEPAKLRPLTGQLYTELAWVNKDMGSYELALDFANRSQTLREEINDQRGIANAMNVKGLIYFLMKNYNESLRIHQQALAIRRSINHREGISASLFNMALVYEELNMLEKALEIQLQALAVDEQVGNLQSVAISYNGVAGLYLKLNNLQEAERYLEKVKDILGQTKSKLLRKNYLQRMSDLCERKKDYECALRYRKAYQDIGDSIYSENANMKLAEMQALYQVERKEQEIDLLNKERDLQVNRIQLQRVQIRNQNVIIALGTGAFLVVSIFVLMITRINKRLKKSKIELAELNEELLSQSEELRESNETLFNLNKQLAEQQEEIQAQAEELQESNNTLLKLNDSLIEKTEEMEAQSEELREANEAILTINQSLEQRVEERTQQLRQAYVELDTFFYRSSHDFRRPITTFMGLAEVAQITVKDENALDLFGKVKETAQALDKMIRKLQSISDVGAQELVYKEVLLSEMVDNILVDFKDELEKKNIRVQREILLTRTFDSYPALVRVILENLIENAIQFSSPQAPYIKIVATTKEAMVVISIEDNGQGIQEEYRDRIFDMYYRANVASKGNGLGLYIVKKAITNLHGNIQFFTQVHGGSVFTIHLPTNQKV